MLFEFFDITITQSISENSVIGKGWVGKPYGTLPTTATCRAMFALIKTKKEQKKGKRGKKK